MTENGSSNKVVYGLLFILALIGLYFSYLLGDLHYMADSQSWLASSLCGGKGSYFDCHKVSNAGFSAILGVPLAFWGMAFFTFYILLLIPLFKGSGNPVFWNILLFWTLAIGSVFDLGLLIYSVTGVGGLCPLCSVTYAANWIALIIMIVKRKSLMPEGFCLKDAIKKLLNNGYSGLSRNQGMIQVSIFVLLAIAALILSHRIVEANAMERNKNKQEQIIQQILDRFQKEKRQTINSPAYPWYGPENAPMTIIEFSDFMCPYCGRVAPILKNLTKQFPGKFKIKFINYPLDITCNTGMTRQLHQGACELAKGLHCAADQGQFWAMHDIIFAQRLNQANTKLTIELGKRIGLDTERFAKCLRSPQTAKAIKNQIEEGDRLGVTGTPALFVNGKRYRAAPHPILFERIMKLELGSK